MNTPVKRCTKCSEEFPATEKYFRPDKRQHRLRSWCRKCESMYSSKWNKDHPEQSRKQIEKWENNHPEKTRESMRKWRNKNHDKHCQMRKNWSDSHPEKGRLYNHQRRSRKEQLPFLFSDTDWQRALRWWYGVCAYCGNPPSLFDATNVLHQEHHVPVSPDYELAMPNPGYVKTNIVPACQFCNLSKGNRNPDIWIIERFGQRKGKAILKRIQDYFEWVKQ